MEIVFRPMKMGFQDVTWKSFDWRTTQETRMGEGWRKRRFSGTTSRKVCTRYNKRTWSHRPRIVVGSSMWDIAALLTAIDTFPICWQTTQSLSTSLRFDACPFEHHDRGEKERRKKWKGIINARENNRDNRLHINRFEIMIVEKVHREFKSLKFNSLLCDRNLWFCTSFQEDEYLIL